MAFAYTLVPAVVVVFMISSFYIFGVRQQLFPLPTRKLALATGTHCFALVSTICIALLYVDSIDLAKALGHSDGDSGLVLGLSFLGSAIGNISAWLMCRRYQNVWASHARVISITWGVMSTLFAASYAAIAVVIDLCETDQGSQLSSILWVLLLAGRLLQGASDGFCYFFLEFQCARLSTPDEIEGRFVYLTGINVVGLGLGPFFAAGSHVITSAWLASGRQAFAPVGFVQVALYGSALLGIILFYPSVTLQAPTDTTVAEKETETKESNQDQQTKPPPTDNAKNQGSSGAMRFFIMSSLGCALIRSYVVSGLEGATALLLIENYNWGTPVTGIAIGGTFMTLLPCSALYPCIKKIISHTAMIRVLLAATLVGSTLIFAQTCDIMGASRKNCPVSLLVGDCCVYPFIYLASAIVQARMMAHALEDGSCFDTANLAMINEVLTSGVGRFLGPWMARVLIESGGQDTYAAQQMTALVLFSVLSQIACCLEKDLGGTAVDLENIASLGEALEPSEAQSSNSVVALAKAQSLHSIHGRSSEAMRGATKLDDVAVTVTNKRVPGLASTELVVFFSPPEVVSPAVEGEPALKLCITVAEAANQMKGSPRHGLT